MVLIANRTTTPLSSAMVSASNSDHHDDSRNPRWRKAIELTDQEAHQSADQLADFDER